MVRKFNYLWLILMYACVCFVFRCFRFETDSKPATSFGLFLLKQSVDSDDFSIKLELEVIGTDRESKQKLDVKSNTFGLGDGHGWEKLIGLHVASTLTFNITVSFINAVFDLNSSNYRFITARIAAEEGGPGHFVRLFSIQQVLQLE
jgi:hypothetical protein